MQYNQSVNLRIKMHSILQTKLKYSTCANCKHTFSFRGTHQFRGKTPLLLQCGHAICEICVKTCTTKMCGICGTIFQPNTNEQANFSPNLYTLGLITASQSAGLNCVEPNITFQQSAAARHKKSLSENIEHCSECGLKADFRCRQCNVFFCNLCYTKIHGRALQSHQKVSLIEDSHDFWKLLSNECHVHPKESVQFHCQKCNVSACTHCLLLSHRDHSIVTQSEKNQELKPQLQDVIEKLTEMLLRVKQTEKKLSKPLPVLDTSYGSDTDREKVEAALIQHFTYLHGVLQNIEHRLINQLQEQQNFVGSNIAAIKERLKEQKNEIENALNAGTVALQESDSAVNMTAIIDKLEQILDLPCHLFRNSVPGEKFSLHIDETITESLKEHCWVEVPPIPNYCLLKTEELPEDYEIEPINREEITLPKKPGIPTLKSSPINLNRSLTAISTSSLLASDPNMNNGLMEGVSENVTIPYIKDPSYFYTQPLSRSSELVQLHKALAKQAATSALPTELELNKLYLVQYGNDMKWYRGRIVKLYLDKNGSQVGDVFYIDYGNTEILVPLSRMRNMTVQSSLVPVMARLCALYDIVPKDGQWSIDANKAMYEMVGGKSHTVMHVYKVCNGICHVDITKISAGDGDRPVSIRDALIFLEYGCFITNERLKRTNPESLRKFFEEEIAIENSYDVYATYIESPDCLYVQKIGDGQMHLTKLTNDMTIEYGKIGINKGIIYTPQIGMPCAVLSNDGMWYRGRVTNLLGNRKVEVFSVDIGCKREYEYDQIRRLHNQFMSLTALAFKISLKDVVPVNDSETILETQKFMIETLESQMLKIFVFSKESDCFKVALYIPMENNDVNFNAMLVEKGYAISTGTSSKFMNMPKTVTKKRKKKGNKAKKYSQVSENVDDEYLANDLAEPDPFRMCVNVLHVVSPDCIYVGDVSCTKVIKDMMEKLQQFYNAYKSGESEEWKQNDVCVAYSAKDKFYHRAKIIEIASPTKVVVFLYDIGITETVGIQDLQTLHPDYANIPSRAFKVKLAGILPCGGSATWVSSSCQVLTDIINENQHSLFYISKVAGIEDDAICVVLWVRETRLEGALAPTIVEINSVNQMLIKKGVALPVRGYKDEEEKVLAVDLRQQLQQNDEKQHFTDVEWVAKNRMHGSHSDVMSDASVAPFSINMSESDTASREENDESEDEYPIPPPFSAWIPASPIIDDKFCAFSTYVDLNCTIYLHSPKQNGYTLAHIDAALQAHFKDSKPQACDMFWAPNDLCIAQYHVDKKWYRAQVLELLENDEVKVVFVDYGNVDECKLGTLRKRVIMEHIPIQATKCVVHGLIPDTPDDKWSISNLDTIHALVVDKKNDITILDRKSDHLVISINLREFQGIDLICYLRYTLHFQIRELDVDSRHDSSDDADVIIEGSIEGCDPRSTSEPMFQLSTSLESKSPEMKPANFDKIISGSLDISGIQNHITTNDFKESITVSSTPQNEVDDGGHDEESEDNNVCPQNYYMFDIPNHVEIINLDPCHMITATEFCAQLHPSSELEFLNMCHQELKRVENDMQEEACDQPVLKEVRLGAPCCAKYGSNGIWYRASITEIEPDTERVKVMYMDYGDEEHQYIGKIHSLKKDWLDVPVMTYRCKLWNIHQDQDAEISLAVMVQKVEHVFYSGVVKAKVKNRCSNKLDVELYSDDECNRLLYENLIQDGVFKIVQE
ncbi:RING finger protein 17 [Neodiprion lecontei]|uniref:RING finger protein 17 n=1 Tax=Neodiprion lecontei TaxID=441921 RepID=A0ABM3G3B3_NEOLC|nr:RING finger protein 17 [Neodiprion lecontei]